jgi:arylamine N-acetyltransferase
LICLDPSSHKQAVRAFLSHYDIEGRPLEKDLVRILREFSRIPYENLSKIIKLNHHFLTPSCIRLPEEVLDGFLTYRLGGTCFSLTFFLLSILEHAGFMAYPVIAHMRNRPNCHCALVLLMNQRHYLIDPGYLLSQPMEIHPDAPRLYRSPTVGVELQFDAEDETYHLYTIERGERKWRYRFQDQPLSLETFLGYWLDSFYQGTMHGICITHTRGDTRLYLHNRYVQVSNERGREKRRLKDDLHRTIEELFGIRDETVDEALEALERNRVLEQKHGLYQPREKRGKDGSS